MTRPLQVALAAAVLGASALACAERAEPDPAPATSAVRLEPPVGLPAMELPDVRGGVFDLRDGTRASVTLVFFGYTHCPDVCPVHMANLAAVMRELPFEVTDAIDVVFVTTDPARDTPERLREWLAALHPRFIGLRPTRERVAELERALGLPPSVVDDGSGERDYFVGHAAQILAFAADDTARVAYPWGTRQRDWMRDLPRLARGEDPLGGG
jgi:protein SCO1/2